mmetsp:Transcript_12596/g.28731  ORF Transcript_12596/g.28731 Transcript_12596/m.28731 type:complete len:798 (+) Transcript_12596:1-2394(+)
MDPTLQDNRDYYGIKRLELAGQLICLLFEDKFKEMNKWLKKSLDTEAEKWASKKSKDSYDFPAIDIPSYLEHKGITDGLASSISTGNWSIKRFGTERSGVSQVLSRNSFIASLGYMTRVKSNFEKSRKVAGPRALQPSQWGMLCPADTPEGEMCGLIKNLTLMAHVTTAVDPSPVKQICYCLGVEDAHTMTGEELHSGDTCMVFLNGDLLGVHRKPNKFMSDLRRLRRWGRVGRFVSIYEDERLHAIFVATDDGRLCRPLIVVDKGVPLLTEEHLVKLIKREMVFDDFLRNSVIEWVDVNEENNLNIALDVPNLDMETTHMEIDPLCLLGAVAGLVPHPNHNQSPRNTYQCAMGKQAMGAIGLNQFQRTDTILYLLCYPQKPLCRAKSIPWVRFDQLGAGLNSSVAVVSYSGYDIEDAIVMNKGSLDRGFGRCQVIKRISCKMDNKQGLPDALRAPEKGESHRTKQGSVAAVPFRHRLLDQDGLPGVGAKVLPSQILINKATPSLSGEWRPSPISHKAHDPTFVDRVIQTDNNGHKVVKVMCRQTRRPEFGDKFSSRHGQKGVCGLIVQQEDMPFSETGWCPDLIMNPHGFPSRMTVGKLMECVGSKAGALEGKFADATIFGGTPIEESYARLLRHGFHPQGKDFITSGITGEPLECYIFCGPIYYQKLKHMVMDKIHARSTGPNMVLTRQPTEGRAKDGGLRLGEMERDCLVAYGVSALLQERLMLSSDVTDATCCRHCGQLSTVPDRCPVCSTARHLTTIRMPYACKLLFQEMQGMNILPKLRLTSRVHEAKKSH